MGHACTPNQSEEHRVTHDHEYYGTTAQTLEEQSEPVTIL